MNAAAPEQHEAERKVYRDASYDCGSAVLGPGPEHIKAEDISLGDSSSKSNDAMHATSVYTVKEDSMSASAFTAKSPGGATTRSCSHGIEAPSHDSGASSFMSNDRGTESGFSLKLPTPCLPAAVADQGRCAGPPRRSVLTSDGVQQAPLARGLEGSKSPGPAAGAGVAMHAKHALPVVQSFPVAGCESGPNSEKLKSSESASSSASPSQVPQPSAPHTPSVAADSPLQHLHAQHAEHAQQRQPSNSRSGSPVKFHSMHVSQSGSEGVQPRSEQNQTFVDILNATPDGPVGQDVANDALEMLKSLGSRSDAVGSDIMMTGGTPQQYSPLMDSQLSRVRAQLF